MYAVQFHKNDENSIFVRIQEVFFCYLNDTTVYCLKDKDAEHGTKHNQYFPRYFSANTNFSQIHTKL